MGYRLATCLFLLMAAGGARAQATVPPSSVAQGSWAIPAPSSSAPASFNDHVESKPAPAKEHFKFKEQKKPAYVTDGPGNPVNRDQVLGTENRSWKDGRPPVNCSVPPFSPACKP